MQYLKRFLVLLSALLWLGKSAVVYDTTCATHLPSRFSQEEQQELCSLQPQSLGPAACAHAMVRSNENRKSIIKLCQQAFSSAAADCFHALGAYSSRDTRLALCSRSNTSVPADCWKAVGMMAQVKPAQRLRVCQAVQSDLELECVEAVLSIAPSSDAWMHCLQRERGPLHQGVGQCIAEVARLQPMEARDIVSTCRANVASPRCLEQLLQERRWRLEPRLCFGAANEHPVHCAAQALSAQPRIPASVVDRLCADAEPQAHGSKYPAVDCFHRLPKTLPKELRADLCRGASNSGPADCFRSANEIIDVEDRVTFCRRAPDSHRVQCNSSCRRLLRHIAPYDDGEVKDSCLSFCVDGAAAERKTCLAAISGISSNGNEGIHLKYLALCETAANKMHLTAMLDCVAQTKSALGLAQALDFCMHAENSLYAAECLRTLPSAVSAPIAATTICAASSNASHSKDILRCLRHSPRSLQEHQLPLLQLCAHASPSQSLQCAESLISSAETRDSDVAHICGRSKSPVRAGSCWRTLADPSYPLVPAELASNVCAHTEQGVMERCLVATNTHLISANEVAHCKNVSRVITSLQIVHYQLLNNVQADSGGARGNVPAEDEPFFLAVRAVDQWGLPITSLEPAERVLISVNLGRESTALLEGTTRNQTDAAGLVTFASLRITEAGVHALHFKLNDQVLHTTRILVTPANISSEPLFRLCSSVFSSLKSVDEALMKKFLSCIPPAFNGALYPMYQVGIVLPKDTLWIVTCRDVYPVWGVETFVTPHGPMIAAFREGVANIVTNRGVPQASSDPRHVLQLSTNYTKQELRRAYLRESQKWHPDKWMDVPAFLQSATAAFQVVASAYEKLASNLTPDE